MHPRWEEACKNGQNANRNHQKRRGEGHGANQQWNGEASLWVRRFDFLCLSQSHFIYVDACGLYVATPVVFMLTHIFVDEEYILNS